MNVTAILKLQVSGSKKPYFLYLPGVLKSEDGSFDIKGFDPVVESIETMRIDLVDAIEIDSKTKKSSCDETNDYNGMKFFIKDGTKFWTIPCPVTGKEDCVIENAFKEVRDYNEDFTWRWVYRYRCRCCGHFHTIDKIFLKRIESIRIDPGCDDIDLY